MRIRQVKPAFWADSRLASLPESVRLFYVGLWMVADDAGWFRWDPVEVARDLYGYDSRVKRERRVVVMFDRLLEEGRVLVFPCGHAFVPKLTEHQRLAGKDKQVLTFEKEHAKCSPAGTRGEVQGTPHSPANPRPVRNGIRGTEDGTERHGQEKVARPLAQSGAAVASDFDERMAAAGLKPELVQ